MFLALTVAKILFSIIVNFITRTSTLLGKYLLPWRYGRGLYTRVNYWSIMKTWEDRYIFK